MSSRPGHVRRIVSEIRQDGMLEIRVEQVLLPALAAGELLVRIEAAPVHPTDLGMMLVAGDLSRAERSTGPSGTVLCMPLFEGFRPMMAARIGKPLVVGNEGAGTVVAAADAGDAVLIGRRVAAFAGGMYADHRILPRAAVTLLPDGATARDGAAIAVNPLTALAMVEVMRRDGATTLVHTAAASSLGQMLQRICSKDGIPLINIVRRPEQVAVLREAGAQHVLVSTDPGFEDAMVSSFAQTDATLAFDAIGGGPLAGMILTAMERAQVLRGGTQSLYGSWVRKRVYIYGRLEMAPTVVPPTTGMAWELGGFLLPHFMQQAGAEVEQRLAARVLAELTTTFAITYTDEIGLDAALDAAILQRANSKATGAKYLIRPDR